jgi:2-methylcitrate dehydratase PrpD
LRFEDLQASTRHAARRCIVDVLGCAASGRHERAVLASTAWAKAVHGQGDSSVWFGRDRLAPVGAAFVNACAASILDLDDGHRVAAGHPGAAIIPAVMAAAQARNASMEDILLAIVAGYEAGVVCARLRSPAAQATVATGRWSTIGVAAALARLMRLDEERTRHALTIAESHAPNLLAADYSGFQGGHVKEGIPWSVVSGFAAAELAANGFLGYDQSFSNPAMYRAVAHEENTGRPLIESTYFKRYACCRWIHSAIDAALQLRAQVPADDAVRAISVETFARAATLPNLHSPRDLIAAQFSVPFMLAAAWLLGDGALLPMGEEVLSDDRVADLARRITVSVVPEFDRMYPLKVPARVTVESSRGKAQATVISPLGDHDNPLQDEALVAKAIHLARRAGVALPKGLLEGVVAGDVKAPQLFATLAA